MSVRVQVFARVLGSPLDSNGAMLGETVVPTSNEFTESPFGVIPVGRTTVASILRGIADELDPEGGR